MDERRKFIRVESWSWNQHLVDYGDDLSRIKTKKSDRKMSVLQSLRRRFSVHDKINPDNSSVSRQKLDEKSSSGILGRGYSSGERGAEVHRSAE
jgi:hypothetical protein